MTQTRSRWLINVVLVLAVVAFVGISMIPLISAAFKESQPSTEAKPTSGQISGVGQQSKLEEQARGYELVLQREPDNQTALRGLVEARIQLRDLKNAIPPLEKLVALNPNQTEYIVLLARVKEFSGDSEGAAQAYRSILQTNPGDLNALQRLVMLLQQQRPEAAISLLQNTLKTASQVNQTKPGSVDVNSVRLILGQVYAMQKNYDEAIAIYDDLIKADKQDFRPLLAKASVLKQQGKTEQAKPLFDAAVAVAPAQYKDQIKQLATPEPAGTTSPTPAPENTTIKK